VLPAGSRPAAALAALALLPLGCGGDDEVPAAGPGGVNIASFEFRPRTVTVEAGGTITWVNRDKAPHTATSDEGAAATFDTERLIRGESKQIAFEKPGDRPYHCIFHPFMRGTVRVVE
jgi:plastocyanin